MKKLLLIISAALVIIGGSVFFYPKDSDSESANAVAPAAGEMAQAVSVMPLKEEEIYITRSLPGRISAFKQSQVRPQVNGIITKRLFEEGATVEKGQQLYQIDDARYKAALNSAQADLRSAHSKIASVKAKSERYEELIAIDAVSHQEYDDVKAELDQANAAVAVANAAVEVARVNLGYTKVYAPISGRIGRSLVTEGALVTANQEQAMAVITLLDPVYIDMQQPSSEAMALQQMRLQGQENIPVTITLGDGANQMNYPHEGSLKFSEVTIDETTGSITLRATIPNPDNILMPGLFVRTNLAIGKQNAVLVPQRATTRGPDGSLNVWVVDSENKAKPHTIEVGNAYKDSWIVKSGINVGETIIIEGYQKLTPDSEVSPTPWKEEPELEEAATEELGEAAVQEDQEIIETEEQIELQESKEVTIPAEEKSEGE